MLASNELFKDYSDGIIRWIYFCLYFMYLSAIIWRLKELSWIFWESDNAGLPCYFWRVGRRGPWVFWRAALGCLAALPNERLTSQLNRPNRDATALSGGRTPIFLKVAPLLPRMVDLLRYLLRRQTSAKTLMFPIDSSSVYPLKYF